MIVPVSGWQAGDPGRADVLVRVQRQSCWCLIPKAVSHNEFSLYVRLKSGVVNIFLLSCVQLIGWVHSSLGTIIYFTQSTDLNVNIIWKECDSCFEWDYVGSVLTSMDIIQKHPHRDTKTMCNQISGHLVAQYNWHINLIIITCIWILLWVNSSI